MGIAAVDFAGVSHSISGGWENRHNQPPAIYRELTKDETLKLTPALYTTSGGSVWSLHSVTHTGTNTQITAPQLYRLGTIIEDIRSAFNLTIEELASACHIQSRKTLYNWINGQAKPRKSAMSRLYDLQMIAKAWRTAGFTADRSQLFDPVLGDKSIFDLLSESKIEKDMILFAGSRITVATAPKGNLNDPFA